MDTTKQRRELIDDAIRAGLTVRETMSSVDINRGRTTRSVGLTLWPDGTATRNDVDFDVASVVRSVRKMREILDL